MKNYCIFNVDTGEVLDTSIIPAHSPEQALAYFQMQNPETRGMNLEAREEKLCPSCGYKDSIYSSHCPNCDMEL